jgi:hypothetical protein
MEKKDWKQRLGSYDSWAMNESMFITIDGETIYTLDKLLDFIQQELDKAREGGRMSAMNELKRAFSKVFYKSGELWFDYLFEDGDTEAEEDAKAVVEGYWEDILSELKDNK